MTDEKVKRPREPRWYPVLRPLERGADRGMFDGFRPVDGVGPFKTKMEAEKALRNILKTQEGVEGTVLYKAPILRPVVKTTTSIAFVD